MKILVCTLKVEVIPGPKTVQKLSHFEFKQDHMEITCEKVCLNPNGVNRRQGPTSAHHKTYFKLLDGVVIYVQML